MEWEPILSRGRLEGKHAIMVEMIRIHLNVGKKIVVAVMDQPKAIARLQKDFPGALFSLVGTWGLKIYRRKLRHGRRPNV